MTIQQDYEYVTEKILEIANLYNEVSTSDLQGMAQATAKEITDNLLNSTISRSLPNEVKK